MIDCYAALASAYEWVQTKGQRKQPIHFHRPDAKPFVFAGLWEKWGDSLLTACLITTDANAVVSPFHDRMPVILTGDAVATWLDPEAEPDHLQSLLTPVADDLFKGEPVSPLLNSPKNDGPELLEPVAIGDRSE